MRRHRADLQLRRTDAIEAAIFEHRRVLLERFDAVGTFADSPDGELRVWPLQLIFHNMGWYLLHEEVQVGREQGLIRSERLDRLALRHSEAGFRQTYEAHQLALERLERLLHHSGGIYFGGDLKQQLAVASSSPHRRSQALVSPETPALCVSASAPAEKRSRASYEPLDECLSWNCSQSFRTCSRKAVVAGRYTSPTGALRATHSTVSPYSPQAVSVLQL